MSNRPLVRASLFTLWLAGAATATAQTTARDLALASLEELMQIEVTSAARREQRVVEIAWPVYVITQDEIRRSGLRSVPEVLRLAPGVQVARVNANKWAVSIRGFNDVFANKLLVMIDGRSIYKRTFGGVYWHAEDLMLEDVDRIEIIRGPGGATWGANAVNGVINIITKPAADTKGGLVRVGSGTTEDSEGGVRYGGRIANLDYRVYGVWADHDGGAAADGAAADDTWHSARIGFRTDYSRGPHTAMVQGGWLDGRSRGLWLTYSPTPGASPTIDGSRSAVSTADLLGRWTYTVNPETSLAVQGFYSRENVREPVAAEIESVSDVEATYRTRIARHHLVSGAGYRQIHRQDNGGSYTISFHDSSPTDHVFNAFVQDEIAVGGRVKATVGAKFERDSEFGWNLLPTGQVIWETVRERQYVWASLDRAVRTPALLDVGLRAHAGSFDGPQGVPVMAALLGNPDYKREELTYFEVGYRVRLGSVAAINASTFAGDYDGLPTREPIEPFFESSPAPPHVLAGLRQENLLEAKTTGLEGGIEIRPGTRWRVEASYSRFRLRPYPDETSRDPAAAQFDGNAPRHQWQLRGSSMLGSRTEVSAALYHVGRLETLAIPAFTRVDARAGHQLGPNLSVIASVQNLFDAAHVEFTSGAVAATQVRRSVHVRCRWRF